MANSRSEAPARSGSTRRGTLAIADALDAAVRTEALCVRALWAKGNLSGNNAFGDAPKKLGDDLRNAVAALDACAKTEGRSAAVVCLAALVDARRKLAELVERRVPVVIHAVITLRGDEPTLSAYADLHAIGDLGVAILYARDAQDAADLTVIAHRAAEDAETPVVIVHDGFPASYARDRVVLPDAPMIRAALEPAPAAIAPSSTKTNLAPHRRAAARIPFALGSAMRAFERHSGRRLHPVEAVGIEGADVVLVATGAISETARATVEHLRSNGNDPRVGVVQLITLRPFPGGDVVKAVGRARGVAVLERSDTPLAQSNPLAAEIKAAFADALTWAPGYPGIGRIPTIFAACVDPHAREASPGDLFAVVDNALLGEQGRRSVRVGGAGEDALAPSSRSIAVTRAVTIRFPGDPSLLIDALVDLYGGHVRATPISDEEYDVSFAHEPVRTHHGAAQLDVVVLPASDDALSLLRDGGVAIARGPVPPAIESALRARNARIVEVNGGPAALCGAVLAAAPPVAPLDRVQALADIERALRTTTNDEAELGKVLDGVSAGITAVS